MFVKIQLHRSSSWFLGCTGLNCQHCQHFCIQTISLSVALLIKLPNKMHLFLLLLWKRCRNYASDILSGNVHAACSCVFISSHSQTAFEWSDPPQLTWYIFFKRSAVKLWEIVKYLCDRASLSLVLFLKHNGTPAGVTGVIGGLGVFMVGQQRTAIMSHTCWVESGVLMTGL